MFRLCLLCISYHTLLLTCFIFDLATAPDEEVKDREKRQSKKMTSCYWVVSSSCFQFLLCQAHTEYLPAELRQGRIQEEYD